MHIQKCIPKAYKFRARTIDVHSQCVRMGRVEEVKMAAVVMAEISLKSSQRYGVSTCEEPWLCFSLSALMHCSVPLCRTLWFVCNLLWQSLVQLQICLFEQIFSRYGQVLKIITFTKNSEFSVSFVFIAFHKFHVVNLRCFSSRTLFQY